MNIIKTEIEGVVIIEPRLFKDETTRVSHLTVYYAVCISKNLLMLKVN